MKLNSSVNSLLRNGLKGTLLASAIITTPTVLAANESKPEAADPAACNTSSRSANLVLLSCPPGTGGEALAQAGRLACNGNDSATCNVWIWTEPAMIPKTAPATDAELPKDSRATAVGVWVNGAQQLLVLKKAK